MRYIVKYISSENPSNNAKIKNSCCNSHLFGIKINCNLAHLDNQSMKITKINKISSFADLHMLHQNCIRYLIQEIQT